MLLISTNYKVICVAFKKGSFSVRKLYSTSSSHLKVLDAFSFVCIFFFFRFDGVNKILSFAIEWSRGFRLLENCLDYEHNQFGLHKKHDICDSSRATEYSNFVWIILQLQFTKLF